MAGIVPYLPAPPAPLQLSSPRHVLTARLADARLEFVYSTRVCRQCLRAELQHEPNCTRGRALGAALVSQPPRPDHSLNLPGLRYSDRWSAPIGLLSANVYISLWLLIVLLAPYPLYVIGRSLLDRLRRRPGACLTCGYDLTGNVSGICPECGRPAVAAP